MSSTGKLNLVSVGPGFADLIVPRAEAALRASDVIVAYELYLEWIKPWIAGKEICSIPLTKEKERATKAIELARQGRTASLVSSGDIGVYAMAALVLEEMLETDTFELTIIPGVSAANSCASLLGSPLSHDFATLSLSDLLCPWEWIENRARHLAQADMVVALYNVQSQQRQAGVYQILNLFREYKSGDTICGVVKNAYREGQEKTICTLAELSDRKFDMLTTILIGNRFTRRKRGFIYTPRGYNSWNSAKEISPATTTQEPSVWIFSGTGDGNALAAELAAQSWKIIVSAASDYGSEALETSFPGLPVRAGRMGVEARRLELKRSQAQAIIDATHPFATQISAQLISLAQELGIPYVRYERPCAKSAPDAIVCRSMGEAAERALQNGRRIFLATGSKDLATFLQRKGAAETNWFARVTPDAASITSALAAGIPRAHLCAMQGPFSREFNEMLWRNWKIDCVVTKESGEAGGYTAKAEAARALGIPLVVVQRPAMDYPLVAHDFSAVAHYLKNHVTPKI